MDPKSGFYRSFRLHPPLQFSDAGADSRIVANRGRWYALRCGVGINLRNGSVSVGGDRRLPARSLRCPLLGEAANSEAPQVSTTGSRRCPGRIQVCFPDSSLSRYSLQLRQLRFRCDLHIIEGLCSGFHRDDSRNGDVCLHRFPDWRCSHAGYAATHESPGANHPVVRERIGSICHHCDVRLSLTDCQTRFKSLCYLQRSQP